MKALALPKVKFDGAGCDDIRDRESKDVSSSGRIEKLRTGPGQENQARVIG